MKLYNEDCLKILSTIPDKSIDLVLTDCPYHISQGGCTNDAVKIRRTREMGGFMKHRRELATTESEVLAIDNTRKGKIFTHNDIEFSDWLPEVYRVLKPNTHCYIMINARNLKELQQVAEDVGFIFQNLLIWDKGNSLPNRYYMNSYELILMLRKGKAKNINDMGTSNILRVPNIIGNKKHPTEKPAQLFQIMIENSTKDNEVVLDPFMGVGGSGIACKNCNREFIGIEIDEKYFNIAKERLEETTKQLSIFDVEI